MQNLSHAIHQCNCVFPKHYYLPSTRSCRWLGKCVFSVVLTHLIHAEEGLVLGYHRILGYGEDLHECLLVQTVQGHHHGQPAHKLRDHAKVDEVTRLHATEEAVLLLQLKLHRARLRTTAIGQISSGCRPATLAHVGGRAEAQVLWKRYQVSGVLYVSVLQTQVAGNTQVCLICH